MKNMINAVAVIALVLMAAAASAQPQPGDAGIFADAAGTQSTLDVETGVVFTLYAVAFDLADQFAAFELKMSGIDGLFVLGMDIGSGCAYLGDVPGQFICALGACLSGEGAVPLVWITLGDLSGVTGLDRAICLTSTVPTSFPLVPGQSLGPGLPGYLTCGGTLIPFGVAQNGQENYPDGCLILNATQEAPISNEDTSFGEMKARF